MTRFTRFVLISSFGVITTNAGCSTSNLDVITRKPATDAGVGGSGVGGSSVGGSGVGGSSTETTTCPTPALGPGDTDETVQVGSTSRSYFLHVPSTYTGTLPVPLILDFHFLGNSGSREQLVSPFPAATESDEVIIAFPNGQSGPAGTAWNIGPCCVDKDVDDVAFSKALVNQLRSKACIDAKRIYAVGYGIGGGMAHYLGCHAADVFAAIAPVGFDLLSENVDDCRPARPITVVSFREISDEYVPYDGGPWTTVSATPITLLGARATFSKWAEINQCAPSPSAEDSNGCATHGACGGGVEVVLCTKQAGVPVPDNGSIAWPILGRHPMP
jgi:polyhydroxybutyrate depolymerase